MVILAEGYDVGIGVLCCAVWRSSVRRPPEPGIGIGKHWAHATGARGMMGVGRQGREGGREGKKGRGGKEKLGPLRDQSPGTDPLVS